MRDLLRHPDLRRSIILRSLESILLLLVVAAGAVGYGKVKATLAAVERQQAAIAARPEYLLRLATIQTQLRDRSPDSKRILQLILDPADIVGFIAGIEATADRHQVVLAVPSINEVKILNAAGLPIDPTGPFRSIQLSINAVGKPSDLLEYVHELEYGPHLVTLPKWSITVGAATPVAFSSSNATRLAGGAPASALAPPPGKLEAEVILLVHNEKFSP